MRHSARRPVGLLALLVVLLAPLLGFAQAQQVPPLPVAGAGSSPLLVLDAQDPAAPLAPAIAGYLLVPIALACPLAQPDRFTNVTITAEGPAGLVIVPPSPAVLFLSSQNPAECSDGYVNGTAFVVAYPDAGTPAGTVFPITVKGAYEANPAIQAEDTANVTTAFAGVVTLALRGPTAPQKPGASFNLTADVTYRYNGPGSVNLKLAPPAGFTLASDNALLAFAPDPAGATQQVVFAGKVAAEAAAKDHLFTLDAKVVDGDGNELPRVYKATFRVRVPSAEDVKREEEAKNAGADEEKDSPGAALVLAIPAAAAVARVLSRRR